MSNPTFYRGPSTHPEAFEQAPRAVPGGFPNLPRRRAVPGGIGPLAGLTLAIVLALPGGCGAPGTSVAPTAAPAPDSGQARSGAGDAQATSGALPAPEPTAPARAPLPVTTTAPAKAPSAAEAPPALGVETSAEGITIDLARGEISFPCRFVNPTRVLEVFACHRTGPTHETVVEFDVTGPEMYRALRKLGLRSARYWNGTSPEDFVRNQGDRVLVLVRWELDGVHHEEPAEGMLLDGPTGFPAYVRGFSVSTRGLLPEEMPRSPEAGGSPASPGATGEGSGPARDPGADNPERGAAPATDEGPGPNGLQEPEIPVTVELTLGASNRQSAVFSLLTHPTNLPRIVPWMLSPELDTSVVKNHARLVEDRTPATLVIRKLGSEEQLVAVARGLAEKRGLDDRVSLYDKILPMAREIDSLKGEYEKLLVAIRELLSERVDPAKLSEGEREERGKRGLELLQKGRWLCDRIQERYFSWYGIEEEAKAKAIEGRQDLPPEVREEVVVLSRRGLAYEPLIAARRVEISSLALQPDLSPAARSLQGRLLETKIEVIETERDIRLTEASLSATQERIRALDPADTYLRRLFEEDVFRLEATRRALTARKRFLETEISELQGLLDGSWDSAKDRVLAERAKAKIAMRIGELEEELIRAIEAIRWSENDAQSGVAEREREATEELEAARNKKADLEAQIAELNRQLGS